MHIITNPPLSSEQIKDLSAQTDKSSIELATSAYFYNKENRAPARLNKKTGETSAQWAYGYSFYTKRLTLDALVTHITEGKAFTLSAFTSNTRRKDTFKSSHLLGLDFDDNVSVADCMAVPFIAENAFFIYATPSSTPDAPKARVLFLLDTPITDFAQWERLQRALIWHFDDLNPDPSCKDAARLFFGSATRDVMRLSNKLSLATMEELATAMEAEITTIAKRSQADNERIRQQNQARVQDNHKQERYYRYASRALDNMASELSSIAEGTGRYGGRNNTLNVFAFIAGTLTGAGMISVSECEALLRSAALSCGLASHEIDTTLSRAIREGEGSPVDLNELDRAWAEKTKQRNAQRRQSINQAYRQAKLEIGKNSLPEGLFENVHPARLQIENGTRAWLSGVHTSWYGYDQLPQGILSALSVLHDTRSQTLLVFGKMHQAFLDGSLNPTIFCAKEVIEATGCTRRAVTIALQDLQEWSYVRDWGSCYISNYMSQELVQNSIYASYPTTGTPPQWYGINDANTIYNVIPVKLLKALLIFYTEKFHNRSLSPFTSTLREQLSVANVDVMTTIAKCAEAVTKKDKLSQEAYRKLNMELNGNGETWFGWQRALSSMFALDIDWKVCHSSEDVRIQILRQWVSTVRSINTQDELCRLLGCSTSTLMTLYEKAQVKSVKRYHQLELTKAQAGKDLRPHIKNAQIEHRGIVQMVRFKRENTAWETVQNNFAPLHYFRTRNGTTLDKPIERVWMQFILPSEQHIMTQEEIEAENAENKANSDISESDGQDKPQVVKTPQTPKKPREYGLPLRRFKHHDKFFVYQWVQLFIHTMTATCRLEGLRLIDSSLYAPGNYFEFEKLIDVLAFVVANYDTSEVQRTTADFMGIDLEDDFNAELNELIKLDIEDEVVENEPATDWVAIRALADLVEVPF